MEDIRTKAPVIANSDRRTPNHRFEGMRTAFRHHRGGLPGLASSEPTDTKDNGIADLLE
jgi:hypothetical protein